ncbi:hypothetical protein BJY04DRAFT_219290 [Aspergillus karnatakaensis]|uniref:uncharacterized protein n=1 Tax=Aspergillus karnatakaensis TaxID=1810916 RepID=UPI003CCE04D6
MQISELTFFVLSTVLFVPSVDAFSKSQCNANVKARLLNSSLLADDDVFYRQSGRPMLDVNNIRLTLQGCEEQCSAGTSFYDDVGPRLSTWLIPILLLIGNMHMARLGNEKYAALLHFLGDPIDTTWSLLTKAETWSRCFSLAQRTIPQAPNEAHEHYNQRVIDVATIYAGIEELEGSGTDKFKDYFDRILADKRDDMTMDHFYHLCKEIANELSDSRSVEIRRAGLAVFAYFYHVIAGFVDVIGGESSSPPGGRIGTSMFISWLIPAVLLSNAIGGFTSRRTCLRIMERFVKTVTHNAVEDRQMFSQDKSSFFSTSKLKTTDFYTAQRWSGAIYCYRPRKILFRGGNRDTSPLTLFILSILPLLISSTTSITLIWVTPTVGFDCRSLMLLAISVLWILSAAFTFLTWVTGLANGVYHYRLTLIKDALIGIPVLLIIILSSCGIFNSCFCWSAVFSLRRGAYVVLDDADERNFNASTWYPGLVAACLGLQMLILMIMLFVVRHGSALFRRDEIQKQNDWLETHVRRSHIRTFTFDERAVPSGWVKGVPVATTGMASPRLSPSPRMIPRAPAV